MRDKRLSILKRRHKAAGFSLEKDEGGTSRIMNLDKSERLVGRQMSIWNNS